VAKKWKTVAKSANLLAKKNCIMVCRLHAAGRPGTGLSKSLACCHRLRSASVHCSGESGLPVCTVCSSAAGSGLSLASSDCSRQQSVARMQLPAPVCRSQATAGTSLSDSLAFCCRLRSVGQLHILPPAPVCRSQAAACSCLSLAYYRRDCLLLSVAGIR
jgi:hypothetical protein